MPYTHFSIHMIFNIKLILYSNNIKYSVHALKSDLLQENPTIPLRYEDTQKG